VELAVRDEQVSSISISDIGAKPITWSTTLCEASSTAKQSKAHSKRRINDDQPRDTGTFDLVLTPVRRLRLPRLHH
jgi:hypothetical protein